MKQLFFLTLIMQGIFCQKTAILVTGPESSGSVYIGQHIAKVLNWNYYGYIPACHPIFSKDENIVVHFSQPRGLNPLFFSLEEIRKRFKDYDFKVVITTRDQNISQISKMCRFNRTHAKCMHQQSISRKILSKLIKNEDCFIWSYETMIYLQRAYFDQLYEFLGLDPDEVDIDPDFYDGNSKYIKGAK